MEDFLVNHTAKRYLFEQSAVREFYSGAYYDLFLVMRGSGVFRCSEVVLPAQQQNLIIFKPGQGGRLEYAGAYDPLELIRVQLSPQTLAQLSDADGERRPMNAICDTTAKSETLSVKGCKVKITYINGLTHTLEHQLCIKMQTHSTKP